MDTHISVWLFLGFFLSKEVSGFLKCLECTHMQADQSIQFENSQNVYKILQSKYNPACSYQNPLDRDEVNRQQQEEQQRNQQQGVYYPPYQYDVGETICGTGNKCQFLFGNVEAYLPSYSATIKLRMYVRNCMTPSEPMENICYRRDTNLGYQDIKNFISDKLGFITPDIQVIRFEGNQCLCGTDRCIAYISGSPNLVLPSITGLLLSLVVSFLL